MTPGSSVGPYEILSRLGAGGMGEVYLALDTRLGRKVALKLLPKELANDKTRRQRFLREARSASALSHPNICIIHEVGETEDQQLFLAMEFVEGQTLEVLIREGGLQIMTLVDLASQIADALDTAHSLGIVHRDIKPANICRTARGVVKVLDFGLAKRLGSDESTNAEASTVAETMAGQLLGTPAYMSPEQAMGKSVDHRSDIFSLGVVIYQMATGHAPFSGGSVGEMIDRILRVQPEPIARFNYHAPAELERIILKCLQKDAERRYQSARELVVDLKNLKRDLEAPAATSGSATAALPPVIPISAALPNLPAPIPAQPIDELHRSDLFITYTQIDDRPLLGSRDGWVSQFHRNLEVRLEQLSGERVRIWPHSNPTGGTEVDERILQRLPAIKAMVSVISPPFARSEACRQEVEQFWRAAQQSGTWTTENKARLFKVVKTPVDLNDLPPSLAGLFQQLFDFEFFDIDPQTGRLREFSEDFGEEARRRFLERIYDLAYEINQVLRSLKVRPPVGRITTPAVGKAVYLAETTSDLRVERDQIRRELQERGFQVLPDAPLPMVAEELGETVRRYLARANAVIHLVGHRYGMVPEGATESLVQMQTRLSAETAAAKKVARFIWTPPGIVTDDDRQAAFLRELREGTAGMQQTELLAGSLEQLKSLVVKHLTAPPPEPKPTAPSTSIDLKRIYLICDVQDETAVEPIEDYLYEQGFEVKVPILEGDPEEFVRMHRENLKLCDAVLIYFGQASAQWVEMKWMDLLKANGYGREKPWLAQAVYIAPPEHRRKERFRSHAVEVIRETGGFQPALLEGFVKRVRAANTANIQNAG